jgi:hypothetical protein
MDSLSKHFYPIDGVAAHLIYSLMKDDEIAASAAAAELASDEKTAGVLFQILCLAWWLQSPNHPLQAARHKAFLENNPHELFSSLLNSPFELPQLSFPSTSKASLAKAIKKRDYESLYTHVAGIDNTARMKIGLHKAYLDARDITVYKPLEERILLHACASFLAYPVIAPPTNPWRRHPPGKKGRTFAVHREATAFWGIKPSKPEELRGDPHKLIIKPLFELQDHEIEFYKTQFPDDIPDEWSDEEIGKSHFVYESESVKNPWRIAFFDCL